MSINCVVKVKVKKLKSKSSSMFPTDYSREIESIVNNNPEIQIEKEGTYFLTDFKIIHVEEKPYVVLRYEREM